MPEVELRIMAIDCCEHTLQVLENVPSSRLTIASKERSRANVANHDVDLIVIGIAQYPVRRLFISELRRVYPDVPLMVLRRVENEHGPKSTIRGEFILSQEAGDKSDLEIVRSLRKILPMPRCEHVHEDHNYKIVRDVMRVITENYTDPQLDLSRVAQELTMLQPVLSKILNQQVGISFRQLLAATRIEEAKRLLSSRQYSVKEVAARVGFSDSHYFSRTFKKHTGSSASEYQPQDAIYG